MFLVFHDGMDGAMEVWLDPDAKVKALKLQEWLDSMGYEDCGVWRAYEKLPRLKIWKQHNYVHGAKP